jgi:hypothetical protein
MSHHYKASLPRASFATVRSQLHFHSLQKDNQMKTTLVAGILGTVIGAVALPAMADDVAKFNGGIGSQPAALASDGKTFIVNDVLGIPPGGRPWVIEELKAQLKEDGRLSVRGEGLVLAGGGGVGTRGGVTQVVATIFCNGNPSGFSSGAVPLSVDGDFEISETLHGIPNLCASPILLIRNAASPGAWFAAGIPKR